MYRWNSQKLEADLANIDGIVAVANAGPGGDVDTDNLVLEINNGEHLFVKGFSVDAFNKPPYNYQLPSTSDVDIEMVELCDGQCSSGGLNSTDPDTIMAYAQVRTYLAQDGAQIVDQLKDYF